MTKLSEGAIEVRRTTHAFKMCFKNANMAQVKMFEIFWAVLWLATIG